VSRWTLEILPQAERDMLAIGEYLESVAGRAAAHEWIAAFESAILSLADNPHLGAESDLLGAGRRRLVVRPYLIIYRANDPDEVRVIRVVDGRRDLPRLFDSAAD
jgi:plasmid stabilization system protein ParE